jgi:hypothetical protein
VVLVVGVDDGREELAAGDALEQLEIARYIDCCPLSLMLQCGSRPFGFVLWSLLQAAFADEDRS